MTAVGCRNSMHKGSNSWLTKHMSCRLLSSLNNSFETEEREE